MGTSRHVFGRGAKSPAKGANSFFLLFHVGVYKLPIRERGPNCIETLRNAPSPISRSFSATTSLLDAAPIGNFAGVSGPAPWSAQPGQKKGRGPSPVTRRAKRETVALNRGSALRNPHFLKRVLSLGFDLLASLGVPSYIYYAFFAIKTYRTLLVK